MMTREIRALNRFFNLRPYSKFLRECRRMSTALLLSLLIHALLLSLSFGGQGLGFPGLDLPWRERRFEADDLRMVLVPARVTAAVPAVMAPPAELKPTAMAKPTLVSDTLAVMAPSPAGVPADAVASTPVPAPALMAVERSDAATWTVPVAPLVPTPVVAAAPSASSPEIVMAARSDAGDAAQKQIDPERRERALELAKLDRAEQEAQRQVKEMETARQEAARQEADRQEVARQAAAREAAVRQEVAQVEASRQEDERQEADRQAAARKEAARVEAARVEAERLAAARQAAVRQELERVEAARVEAGRQEAARQETARQEKAGQEAARDEQEARHQEARRAMGRQLNDEAARREAAALAARPSSTLLPAWSSARRGRLFGRADPNAELILYAEAWSRKIELNMTFDMVREAAKRPHTTPLVTVALRSDGSVESVTFVLSSGVAAIDEAIRRIVQSQAPYPAFQPALARDFDVVEIRRSWNFDMAIRLY